MVSCRGTVVGMTSKIVVFPGFCGMNCCGGGAPPLLPVQCYGSLACHPCLGLIKARVFAGNFLLLQKGTVSVEVS